MPDASNAKIEDAGPLRRFHPIVEEALTFPLLSVPRRLFVIPVYHVEVRVVREDDAFEKTFLPIQVLLSERRVEDADELPEGHVVLQISPVKHMVVALNTVELALCKLRSFVHVDEALIINPCVVPLIKEGVIQLLPGVVCQVAPVAAEAIEGATSTNKTIAKSLRNAINIEIRCYC